MNLRQKIEQEIRERGPMPFSRYMEMCLYDPELGYYSRPAEKFGKAGDFYTSSDVHAVFGRLLARQFEEMWRVLDKPEQLEILELGPGRGLFAQDVLDWSEKKFPEFYRALRYTLVERSPSLRERLRALFGSRLEAGKKATAFVQPLGGTQESTVVETLERLLKLQGKILLLGCDHDAVTFLHYAEHIADTVDHRDARRAPRTSGR